MVIPYKIFFNYPIESILVSIKDWVTLNLNLAYLKIAKVENDLDIYYGVGNTNTQRQEIEITAIMKKT